MEEGREEAEKRLAAEQERWSRARKQLAGRTRRVEAMRRLLDDRPGRAELSQYQRRFIELSNQGESYCECDTSHESRACMLQGPACEANVRVMIMGGSWWVVV